MFGVIVFLAVATCLNVPVACDEVMWPDGIVNVDISLDIKNNFAYIYSTIMDRLYYLQYVSCLRFHISNDNPPTDNYYFRIEINTYEDLKLAPKSCGIDCERKIVIINNDGWTDKRRLMQGIAKQLGVDVNKEVLNHYEKKQLNEIYKCNVTCVFLPKCKNGGYAIPGGLFGCGKCLCPNGIKCQDEEVVVPNKNHEMMKAGTTALFTESIKNTVTDMFDDAVSDSTKGAIGGGAGVAMMDVLTGKEENIPADVSAAVIESLICSKLENVFEKAATGNAIAAGAASAAVGVVQDLARGDVAGAIKTGISKGLGNYIGSAIGSFLGSAIGGPFGTIIGAMIGAIIGEAVSLLIREILDFLTPYFETAAKFIEGGNWLVIFPGANPVPVTTLEETIQFVRDFNL